MATDQLEYHTDGQYLLIEMELYHVQVMITFVCIEEG